MRHGPTIAIIGGGASGGLCALHLLRSSTLENPRIVVFEREGDIARGVAYRTREPVHLLNVPAGCMSAFGEVPDHFVGWLRHTGNRVDHGDYVARSLFGDYLVSTLQSAIRAHRDMCFELVAQAATDIEPVGGKWRIKTASGSWGQADAVVLATGHAPARMPATFGDDVADRCVADPWQRDALDRIGLDDSVTLLGSGLTAVDVTMTLTSRGHRGAVMMLSRHGLLPAVHADSPLRWHGDGTELPGESAAEVLHSLRRVLRDGQAMGVDWRAVIDSLRVQTPELWRRLPTAERDRFLRHARRYWDIHRHRMPPGLGQQIARLRASGRLRVCAGQVRDARLAPEGLLLDIRCADTSASSVATDHLVNCTGPGHFDIHTNPLLSTMSARGLIRPSETPLGLMADAHGRVLNQRGQASETLRAIGPVLAGERWETTAIPEIRSQAASLSAELSTVVRHLMASASNELSGTEHRKVTNVLAEMR